MKRSKVFAIPVALVVFLGVATIGRGQGAPPANPVQVEMRLLREAMRCAVDAIALGDVRGLPKRLHAVHVAAGDTREIIEKGEYTLPSAADQLPAFLALDEAFHRDLIKMVKAAKNNDVVATAEAFGGLMRRCPGCHAQFAVRPVPAD